MSAQQIDAPIFSASRTSSVPIARPERPAVHVSRWHRIVAAMSAAANHAETSEWSPIAETHASDVRRSTR